MPVCRPTGPGGSAHRRSSPDNPIGPGAGPARAPVAAVFAGTARRELVSCSARALGLPPQKAAWRPNSRTAGSMTRALRPIPAARVATRRTGTGGHARPLPARHTATRAERPPRVCPGAPVPAAHHARSRNRHRYSAAACGCRRQALHCGKRGRLTRSPGRPVRQRVRSRPALRVVADLVPASPPESCGSGSASRYPRDVNRTPDGLLSGRLDDGRGDNLMTIVPETRAEQQFCRLRSCRGPASWRRSGISNSPVVSSNLSANYGERDLAGNSGLFCICR